MCTSQPAKCLPWRGASLVVFLYFIFVENTLGYGPALSAAAMDLSFSTASLLELSASSVLPLRGRPLSSSRAHALHHLLLRIASGGVTAVDLQRAIAAKRLRRQPSPPRSGVCTPEGGDGRGAASPPASVEPPTACCCRAACSVAVQLERVMRNLECMCDSHGRLMHAGSSSAGEFFCRPLAAFFARRALQQFQEASSHAADAACMRDRQQALPPSWPAEEERGGALNNDVVVYDELRLLDNLRLLRLGLSHVLHLCFWAASRLSLSQPGSSSISLSSFFQLLHAAAFSADAWRPDKAAAAVYVQQVVAVPFLCWWEGLLAASSSPAAKGNSGSRGSARKRPLHESAAAAAAAAAACTEPQQLRSARRSRHSRRFRVAAWEALLRQLVEGSSGSVGALPACMHADMHADRSNASEALCSLLFARWDAEFSGRAEREGLPQELLVLQHARRCLKLKFVFVDAAKVTIGFGGEHDEETDFFSAASHQTDARREIHVRRECISLWFSWLLHRHRLLAAAA
ncbi:hypothetical protein Efla_006947 [Eimeria flavescens]